MSSKYCGLHVILMTSYSLTDWDFPDCWLSHYQPCWLPRIRATRMSHKSEQYLTNPKSRLLYQSWGSNTLTLPLQWFSCPPASHPVTPSTMMTCLSWSKSSWCIPLAALKLLMHPAWSMASVLRGFLSLLESTPLSLKIPMPVQSALTLASLIRSETRRSTTNGWSAIPLFSSGNTGAISMWSLSHQ